MDSGMIPIRVAAIIPGNFFDLHTDCNVAKLCLYIRFAGGREKKTPQQKENEKDKTAEWGGIVRPSGQTLT